MKFIANRDAVAVSGDPARHNTHRGWRLRDVLVQRMLSAVEVKKRSRR
ncbi:MULTISPECIES: hypothetical protein [unclassified Nostoc]|nr:MULTISPECIES: hypothetical protein [unclassified Nostoc]